MEPWLTVFLLKPIAIFGVAGAYYVTVYKLSKRLERWFPEGRLKRALFRERGTYGAGSASDGD